MATANAGDGAMRNVEHIQALLQDPKQMRQLARWYFRSFDENLDGVFEVNEIHELCIQLFADLGLSPPKPSEIDGWIKLFDTDKSGAFSLAEFERFFCSALQLSLEDAKTKKPAAAASSGARRSRRCGHQ